MTTHFVTAEAHVTKSTQRGRGFRSRYLGKVAAAVLGISLLAGCANASNAEEADGGSTDELEEFTFLSYLPMESLSMAPEMMAIAGGYFEKHGLDVTVQEVKGSPQAMQTLLAGTGDLTRVGGLDLYSAAEEMPMRNVGTIVRSSSIKVLNAEEDPLVDPEDFVDKTIGVPSEGGSSDKTLSLMLSNAGIDPDRVTRQVVGLTPATFELVQQGTLAGYMVSTDSALIASKQNENARIYDFGTSVQADTQVYVATPEGIENNTENLEKYLAAIDEAVTAIVEDETLDETIEVLRSEYDFTTLMDDEIAKEGLEAARTLWTGGDASQQLLVTDEEQWVTGYEELVDAGMAEEGPDVTEWMDNSLLPE